MPFDLQRVANLLGSAADGRNGKIDFFVGGGEGWREGHRIAIGEGANDHPIFERGAHNAGAYGQAGIELLPAFGSSRANSTAAISPSPRTSATNGKSAKAVASVVFR